MAFSMIYLLTSGIRATIVVRLLGFVYILFVWQYLDTILLCSYSGIGDYALGKKKKKNFMVVLLLLFFFPISLVFSIKLIEAKCCQSNLCCED